MPFLAPLAAAAASGAGAVGTAASGALGSIGSALGLGGTAGAAGAGGGLLAPIGGGLSTGGALGTGAGAGGLSLAGAGGIAPAGLTVGGGTAAGAAGSIAPGLSLGALGPVGAEIPSSSIFGKSLSPNSLSLANKTPTFWEQTMQGFKDTPGWAMEQAKSPGGQAALLSMMAPKQATPAAPAQVNPNLRRQKGPSGEEQINQILAMLLGLGGNK